MAKAVPAAVALLVAVLPSSVSADDGPPIHLGIVEREAGRYEVTWRVPRVLPARALPTPVLPDGCATVGDREVVDQADYWVLRQVFHCDRSLAGQLVSLKYPTSVPALTTVIRIDLENGDRFGHVLQPGEFSWRVPRGTVVVDSLRRIQRAVWAGVSHAVVEWPHLALIAAFLLLGSLAPTLRLLTVFSLGQIIGIVAGRLIAVPAPVAELAIALAAAVVVARAVTPSRTADGLAIPLLTVGVIHGAGLGQLLGTVADGGAGSLLAVLGMDAAQLAVVMSGLLFARTVTRGSGTAVASILRTARKPIAYATGIGAMALALAFATGTGAAGSLSATAPVLPVGLGDSMQRPGSRRVAAGAPSAPVRSYLTVEPFEVRHEVMLRVADLAPGLGLDVEPGAVISVAEQPAAAAAITEYVLERTGVVVDGERREASVRRADFMVVGPGGSLPRSTPEPEPVGLAHVGVVITYATEQIPAAVELTWNRLDEVSSVPVTIVDPESVRTRDADVNQPMVRWVNELVDDPLPAVDQVPVEPFRVLVPWVSVPLFILAIGLLVATMRRPRDERPATFALCRVTLAGALLLGPLVSTAVAVPGSAGRRPSEDQARRILAALLPNAYHAMEYGDEESVYDRLAVSVTGEALTEVYLEQQRALRFEERGGARARVESVEVMEARNLESGADGGISLQAMWTAGGSVTHFGHRHFRQNRYSARIGLAPVDGAWKINDVEILEQERVR